MVQRVFDLLGNEWWIIDRYRKNNEGFVSIKSWKKDRNSYKRRDKGPYLKENKTFIKVKLIIIISPLSSTALL